MPPGPAPSQFGVYNGASIKVSSMADIFISYSKKDEPDARLLSAFLEAQGYAVWWDADLEGGDKYRGTIAAELSKARAVVVIWTKNSVGSDWVQSEAGRALNERKLIPLRSVGVEYGDIPPPFDNVHTLTLNNREQILAAVAGQLAKPAEPAPGWKVLRFELLTWLGAVSGAITLVGIIQGVFTLSSFSRWLLTNWSALLKHFWQALVFFKFEVSVYDAEVLTILLLMISAVFYSSFRRPINPVRKSAWFLLPPLFLIWVILFYGMGTIAQKQTAKFLKEYETNVERMFANNPECVSVMKRATAPDFLKSDEAVRCYESSGVSARERDELYRFATQPDKQIITSAFWRSLPMLEQAVAPKIDIDAGVTTENVIRFVLSLCFLLAWIFSPIILPFLLYWAASFILPLNLQVSVLSRRLWRTLILFGGIIITNYVAVGIELAVNWFKTIPDLS
jgi:hypothetical protein